jgi:glycosyltransferase involved in cell wall biosynthesis
MLRDFVARGYRVTAIGSHDLPEVRTALEGWGVEFVIVPIRRAGLNPVLDLIACWLLYRALRRLRPDLVLAYTVKPVVYGMPVAWLAGVKRRYAMITGRGYAFLEGNERSRRLTRRLATWLYRFGLRFAHGVLFHNEDDRAFFADARMTSADQRTRRIWGSGINLDHHRAVPLPPLASGDPVRFLMIGRLIRDKGVNEYAEAARVLRAAGAPAEFLLVGPTDPSPNAVSPETIAEWAQSGTIDYRGPVDDVRPAIAASHVVVLPSYAEGLPRSVLEGMAAGRPVITTLAPGCRDTVVPGESGMLVPMRDASALAAAMQEFIDHPELIARLGQKALERARTRFEVGSVNRDIADFLGI